MQSYIRTYIHTYHTVKNFIYVFACCLCVCLLLLLLCRLSPEARSLLDGMLSMDESSRLTIQGIKEHSWVVAPQPAFYEERLAAMAEQQAAMEKQVLSGRFRSKERDRAIDALVHRSTIRAPPQDNSHEVRRQPARLACTHVRGHTQTD